MIFMIIHGSTFKSTTTFPYLNPHNNARLTYSHWPWQKYEVKSRTPSLDVYEQRDVNILTAKKHAWLKNLINISTTLLNPIDYWQTQIGLFFYSSNIHMMIKNNTSIMIGFLLTHIKTAACETLTFTNLSCRVAPWPWTRGVPRRDCWCPQSSRSASTWSHRPRPKDGENIWGMFRVQKLDTTNYMLYVIWL